MNTPLPKTISRLLFLGILVPMLTGGCVNVKPWERGALADYTMRPDRDPIGVSQKQHMWFSREEANGGGGVGGGGCGCN